MLSDCIFKLKIYLSKKRIVSFHNKRLTVFKSSLLVITLVSIYRKKSTRCTALSVWNVVKDRRASEKINFRPESECKGTAFF